MAREAISARIDGEEPGLPDDVLDVHLGACAGCQDWQQRAHDVTRRARLGGSSLNRDLSPQVLAAVPAAAAGRRRLLVQRAGLAVVAVAQLAITVPLLIFGHDHDAGPHAAHELGSFDLALAIAFAVGAIRPALSAGLAWPCGIAAAGLAGTAIVDLIGGQTIGADEAQHLIAVAGALLLVWQAGRTSAVGGRRGGRLPRRGRRRPRPPRGLPGRDAAAADRSYGFPGGGEAAGRPFPASPPAAGIARPARSTERRTPAARATGRRRMTATPEPADRHRPSPQPAGTGPPRPGRSSCRSRG